MAYITEGTISAIGIIFPCGALICLAVRLQDLRRNVDGIEIDSILSVPAAVCALLFQDIVIG